MTDYDLFGNPIEPDILLRDKFIEPPFSVLDTKSGRWQDRKRKWVDIGIKSEVSRNGVLTLNSIAERYPNANTGKNYTAGTSIFDSALCELIYHWFCPENGSILDPFAGGSVRGIVAHYLGYKYTGIDIRQEQIDSNREQALNILETNNQPSWYVGDADKVLSGDWQDKKFDMVFSCPPYANLEKYSDLQGDISNMDYDDFMVAYRSIINKSCSMLKRGGYACFVVGEVRDKKGNYIGFVPDTIRAFQDAGMKYYNEGILLESGLNTAAMRADRQFTSGKKLVKIHQNVLTFRKP